MKKRLSSFIGLLILLLSLSLSLVGCGSDESVKGVSISAYCNNIEYDSAKNRSDVWMDFTVRNNNSNCCIEQFVYCVRFYDVNNNLLEARERNYTSPLEAGETVSFELLFSEGHIGNIDGIYGNVAYVSVVPVSMELGAATPDDDKPVFTDTSTWGIGAWIWVIIAGIFAFGGVFDIICAVVEFVDWGDIDSEEGWGMLIGGIICIVLTVVILVLLF